MRAVFPATIAKRGWIAGVAVVLTMQLPVRAQPPAAAWSSYSSPALSVNEPFPYGISPAGYYQLLAAELGPQAPTTPQTPQAPGAPESPTTPRTQQPQTSPTDTQANQQAQQQNQQTDQPNAGTESQAAGGSESAALGTPNVIGVL